VLFYLLGHFFVPAETVSDVGELLKFDMDMKFWNSASCPLLSVGNPDTKSTALSGYFRVYGFV
jgi:hypothetical protein